MNIVLVIILPAVGGVLVAAALTVRWRRRRASRRQIYNDLLVPNVSDDRFASHDAALLPHPVARYFRHSVPGDRPTARTVDVDLIGEARARPDAEWTRFAARHRICPGRGYLCQTRLEGIGPIAAEGAEYLCRGVAGADYCLGGWLPLVRACGEDWLRVASERLAVESFWLPCSTLPDRGVSWRALDEYHATAVFPAAAGHASVNVTIDGQGALVTLSMLRWRRSEDGVDHKAPFGMLFSDEARFDGYALPRRAVAIWDYGTDAAFECARLELEAARFY
jgi:hypothetical protein